MEWILKWQPGEASIIGWRLQTRALIMIIVAKFLLDKGVSSSETLTALLHIAVASTMLTVPMVTPKLARTRHIATQAGPCQPLITPVPGKDLKTR